MKRLLCSTVLLLALTACQTPAQTDQAISAACFGVKLADQQFKKYVAIPANAEKLGTVGLDTEVGIMLAVNVYCTKPYAKTTDQLLTDLGGMADQLLDLLTAANQGT